MTFSQTQSASALYTYKEHATVPKFNNRSAWSFHSVLNMTDSSLDLTASNDPAWDSPPYETLRAMFGISLDDLKAIGEVFR